MGSQDSWSTIPVASLVTVVSAGLVLSCGQTDTQTRTNALSPVSTTRVHGPSSRPEFTARVDGCQKIHPSSRAVNSGSGNRAWPRLSSEWVMSPVVVACKLEGSARTYRGPMRSTVSGKMCQHWSSQSPHEHSYTDDTMYTDGSVELADNFCRNPDSEYNEGAWCYTMDPEKRWELCDVPLCRPRPGVELDAGVEKTNCFF